MICHYTLDYGNMLSLTFDAEDRTTSVTADRGLAPVIRRRKKGPECQKDGHEFSRKGLEPMNEQCTLNPYN